MGREKNIKEIRIYKISVIFKKYQINWGKRWKKNI